MSNSSLGRGQSLEEGAAVTASQLTVTAAEERHPGGGYQGRPLHLTPHLLRSLPKDLMSQQRIYFLVV